MRFNKISITNMRLIGDEVKEITFDSEKNIHILLGNNGFGKTTILDALATTMAPFAAQFPGVQDFQLSDLDVHINRHGHRANYLTVSAELCDKEQNLSSIRYRKGTTNPPKTNYEQLRKSAIDRKEAIIAGVEKVDLPVFAYYGTGRGQFKVPERKRGFQQTYERWDSYKSAICPETDFKRFFGWFDLMEDEERREREARRDFDYKSPILEIVRYAIARFVSSYINPRIETRPLRFVMDRTEADGTLHELRIEQLSEGYKIVIAMVADLAARMAEANPQMKNPLEGSGIVLIDEVDLHLHPQWQREIIGQLVSVFPHMQFIVSTHSPIIVMGAARIAQVINLNKDDANETDWTKSNIGLVLLSDLFGLKSLNAPQWDKLIQERNSILAKSELTDADNTRLQELDNQLSGVTAVQDSTIIRSNIILQEIAKQMNIQL